MGTKKKKHNEKAKLINYMARESEGREEGPKAEIHMDLLKMTLKNIEQENARPWWNTWILVQEILRHSRQTSTRNEQMPTRSTITGMNDQRKDHIEAKGLKQRNRPNQLQTYNLPSDDEEIINSTNKRRDLLLANKPRNGNNAAKIQRHSRVTLYRSAHPKREQDQTEKFSFDLNWPQKCIWYGPKKLDDKVIDYMYQDRREEDDLPVLKTALTHRYN